MTRFAACASAALLALLGTADAGFAQPGGGGPSARPNEQLNRITCRRFTRIGSLIDGYRVCKTNREWQREHDNVRQLATTDSCGQRGESPANCGQ